MQIERAEPDPLRRRQATRRVRVLLAEDDPGVSLMVATALSLRGFQVTCLPDGMALLDTLLDPVRGVSFDVLLTDLRLPGMGGLEVLTRTRDVRPPTIVITGLAAGPEIVDALAIDQTPLLRKPIDVDVLHGWVIRALARRHTPSGISVRR